MPGPGAGIEGMARMAHTLEATKTIARTGEMMGKATPLVDTLRTATADRATVHTGLVNLAGKGSERVPNLIVDAKGTAVHIPTPAEARTATPLNIEGLGKKPVSQIDQFGGTRIPPEQVAAKQSGAKVEAPGQVTPKGGAEGADTKTGNLKKETRQVNAEVPQQGAKTETSQHAGKAETASPTAEKDQQRITELQGKIKDGSATPDDLKEYRGLKGQESPESRRQILEKKILEGNFTDEEATEWKQLAKDEKTAATPEQAERKKLQQEMDALGEKIVNGEGDRAENMLKLQELKDKANGLQSSVSEAQARQMVDSILHPDKYVGLKPLKELAEHRMIKEKLERLMALEMQVATAPQRLRMLKEQADRAKAQIARIEGQTQGEAANNEEKFKQRMERYGHYMQLNNIQAEITKTKAAVPILMAEYRDTMQYVRRKLGITHGFQAFLEWAEAKVGVAASDIYLDGVSLSSYG